MAWTTEQKIESLLRLPWTITSEPADDAGEFVVRVAEIPGMIVVGTPEEVDAEFWPALRASLSALLEYDDPIPLPTRVKAYPWDPRAAHPRRIVLRSGRGDAWEVRDEADTAGSETTVTA